MLLRVSGRQRNKSLSNFPFSILGKNCANRGQACVLMYTTTLWFTYAMHTELMSINQRRAMVPTCQQAIIITYEVKRWPKALNWSFACCNTASDGSEWPFGAFFCGWNLCLAYFNHGTESSIPKSPADVSFSFNSGDWVTKAEKLQISLWWAAKKKSNPI